MATATNKRERGKRRVKRPRQFKYPADTLAARRKCGYGQRHYGSGVLIKAFRAFARIIEADGRTTKRRIEASAVYRRLRARDRRSKAYKKWRKQWNAWFVRRRRRR